MEKPGTPADTPHPHPKPAPRPLPKCRNHHPRMSVGGSRLKEYRTLLGAIEDTRTNLRDTLVAAIEDALR